MKGAQKAIKYFALALSALLIVTIFAGIVGGLSFVGMMVWGDEAGFGENSSWTNTDVTEEVVELDVNVKATSLKIRRSSEGEAVRIDTNNDRITSWVDGRRLNIVEKSHGFFGWGGTGELVIYVRDDVRFEKVKIEAGAGSLTIGALETRELDLDLGAGKTSIESLKVTERTKIESGAGLVEVKSGELHGLDLDLGAGKTELRARLVGNARVNAGVGKTELTLMGRRDDYRFDIDKGLGSVTLDGEDLRDGASVGTGDTRIDIDSGVGAVEIRIVEE